VTLGRALFFDVDLSWPRTQSCATCHDPARAFSDSRDNGVAGALSLGADGTSLGTRNAPALTYAALVPPFGRDTDGHWVGGFFHDGRARDLADQAGQPMLDPREMQMPDAAAVVARVRAKPGYVDAISKTFGASALESVDGTFAAVRAALAAYERSPEFVAFDSRYDRFLAGEIALTREEEIGRILFFSGLTNCASCHLSNASVRLARETFTNHRYFNIGVPARMAAPPDRGLRDNPDVADDAAAGAFRVPTLRNVAVTAPYMHNGVFRELDTVMLFYDQYVVHNPRNASNPETGLPWAPPDVAENIDFAKLRAGQPMDEDRIHYLVAFMRALTDRRFEHLLEARSRGTGTTARGTESVVLYAE
jgi:cytochrome c peroxidase